MKPISPETLLDALNWRYAVKKFDSSRKIPDAIWNALEQSLLLTPSSFGLQPWKFLIVRDGALRESLLPHSWGQRQVVDCSHLVVILVRRALTEDYIDHFIQRTAEVRGIPPESLDGYRQVILNSLVRGERTRQILEWARDQAYIALGNFMTGAALLGIDTCPMEGIHPSKYDEILDLNASPFTTAVTCAAGYRAADDQYAAAPKVRFNATEIIERR